MRSSASGSNGAADPSLDRRERGESEGTDRARSEHPQRSEPALAHLAEREHEAGHAERERQRAGDVEAHAARRRLAQHGEGEGEGEEREARLHREDDAPAEPVDERTAHSRPSAGAPAAVIDHQPIARTRCSRGVTLKISAIAVGCVAPPSVAASVRNAISATGLQANEVATAVAVAAAVPNRKMRRCPRRSPSLPSSGSATAEISIGAAITHAIVVSRVPNSRAIDASDTVRIVIGKVEANMPESAASRTHVG